MTTEDLECSIMYYDLGSLEVLTVRFGTDRIEYTSLGTSSESKNNYFIHYDSDKGSMGFSLDTPPMIDLSGIEITPQNEDQFFQLMCVQDFSGLDPYVLVAVQKYCKEWTRKVQNIYKPNIYYPITIQVLRH